MAETTSPVSTTIRSFLGVGRLHEPGPPPPTGWYPAERYPSAPPPQDLTVLFAKHPPFAAAHATLQQARTARSEADATVTTLQARTDELHRLSTTSGEVEIQLTADDELAPVRRQLRLAHAKLDALARAEREAVQTWHQTAQAVQTERWRAVVPKLDKALEAVRVAMQTWADEETAYVAAIEAASPPGVRFSSEHRGWREFLDDPPFSESKLTTWRRREGLA